MNDMINQSHNNIPQKIFDFCQWQFLSVLSWYATTQAFEQPNLVGPQ